ncbi:hypothetical protein F4859DRAFT_471561 [Xylaria cf. heliscus]|nr:hypothetical protein F4859DRAFT_471561 [Xylaria cf. heliscus]
MWPFGNAYPEVSLEELSDKEYDYVVVGGGTAGCAVASRLSEDTDVTVLLLERGPVHDSWISQVPLASCSLDSGPGIVRRYSTPNKSCNDRKILLCNSESVGGTSRINGMLYTRGMPAAYDLWARETGYSQWSWDQVEPYYHKIEGVLDENLHRSGRAGPLQLRRCDPLFDYYGCVEKSTAALGLQTNNQLNSPDAPTNGYFPLDHTIDSQGYRHSALRAYLPKALVLQRRGRLVVCANAIASRLEIDEQESVVTGVHVQSVKLKTKDFIRARREVIVCGGAIRSPQLLQLSGIGPASLMEKHGIPLKRDLHVGLHLADHVGVPICLQVPLSQTLHSLEKNPLHAGWHLLRFLYDGTGRLSAAPVQAAIFLDTADLDLQTSAVKGKDTERAESSETDLIPDVEVMVTPASTIAESYHGQPIASLYTCLVRPRSEGSLEIESTNPEVDPLVHLDLLSDPADIQIIRKALRFSLALAGHFVHESGFQYPAELHYAPEGCPKPTDEQLDMFTREKAQAGLHLACTCRMAKEENGGVVDEELRVHGFKNLRVADTSVFPSIPSGHTMAPAYMVAERCADFIKKRWT